MFTSWRTKVKKVEGLIASGQLTQAAHEAMTARLSEMRAGRSTLHRLSQTLVSQAQRFSSMADYAGAWENMSWAARVSLPGDQDHISKETTRLVDQTIEHAQQLLECGKPAQANRVATLLSSRKILDRRADEVRQICHSLRQIEQMTAEGKLSDAANMLDQINHRYPQLTFVGTRADSLREQKLELSRLHGELATAINQSNWNVARQLSGRMLQIAPNYQIAIDAIRQCQAATSNRTNVAPAQKPYNSTQRVSILESSPGLTHPELTSLRPRAEQLSIPDIQFMEESPRDNQRFEKLITRDDEVHQILADAVTETRNTLEEDTQVPGQVALSSISELSSPHEPFMMWVDGVGGFWVCLGEQVTLGQDSSNGKVDLPIQGDLGRSQIRIVRAGDTYVLIALEGQPGAVCVDGGNLQKEILLGEKHTIDIAKARLKFRRPHPLSNSAVLSIQTRHRTVPWSDGIVLLGSSIILGPDPGSHIICPDWKDQLVIFVREGKLFCKHNQPFEVDDIVFHGESAIHGDKSRRHAKLSINSRISGEDFSVTFEPIENI